MGFKGFTRAAALVASVSLAALATIAAAQPAPGAPVTGGGLQDLDLWSVQGRDTGLDASLWEGAAAGLFDRTMAQIGSARLSAAERVLARRVLATAARAPEGAEPALAARRAASLLALGDLDAASVIAGQTPQVLTNAPLARVGAEAALWRGDDDRACAIEAGLLAERQAVFWLRLRAYCRLAEGRERAAEAALGLWREAAEPDDAFESLFEQALAETASGPADVSDALNWALSRRLGLSPPPVARRPAPLVAAQAAAGDVEAAAFGLRQGIVAPQVARAAYMAQPAPSAAPVPATVEPSPGPVGETIEPPPGPAGETVEPPAGPAGEAALYQLIRVAAGVEIATSARLALLARGETPEDFIALARLAGPEISTLSSLIEPGAGPAVMALAAAVDEDPETARSLFSRTIRAEGGWSAGQFALMEAVVAASDPPLAGPTLDRLVERGAGGDRAAQGAAMLLAALGVDMGADARSQFAAFDVARPRATPARLTALEMAGVDGRAGEAALLALSIVRQQPDGLSLADRAAIVAALRRAGLGEDARAFAIEGLLALALPAL